MDKYEIDQRLATARVIKWITLLAILLLFVIVGAMIGCPVYNVYQQRKEGEANLAHAQSSKEVAVAEAKAKKESASYLADADTIRAIGIARSNRIIGSSITKEYLEWFWIDNIDKTNHVFYVPTERNLPILAPVPANPSPAETTK